ncbi:uncharacterized protein C2845_PM04G07810 [Panicum miliaceum]|uniref:Uncharacterized protein n=1 Tax=Panicum miliaceum TaxID=4540 RepID=A0A3L6QP16_PANMI|nr:uncharacterized protein C2845_PM04G07810 [Panicum miliaceum]
MDGGEEEAMNNLGFWRSTPRRRRQPSSRGSCWATTCKCGKPRCRGLKKAMEFNIQLKTEEYVCGHPKPAARSTLLTAAPRRAQGQATGAGGRAPEDGAAQ